jgi:hypothetical protein
MLPGGPKINDHKVERFKVQSSEVKTDRYGTQNQSNWVSRLEAGRLKN